MITLKNLLGKDRASPAFSLKWTLINNFNVWSRKLWLLIEQLREEQPALYKGSQPLQLLRHEILGPFFDLRHHKTPANPATEQ